MNKAELKQYCISKMQEYPTLKPDITEFYQLALNEIEQGESEANECHLCVSSIDELINDL